MAINGVILDVVMKTAAEARRPCRMLCLGYPDMLVTEAQIAQIIGREAAAKLAWREDSESILRWHGLQGTMPRMAETRSLFAAVGVETEFVDIVASRGFETVLDLNQALPQELRGRYDVVYDGGTMEHCFNVGQVMRNIAAFARPGGFIVHVNPMNLYNHGFFNFNPTFYYDWYVQSGNQIASPFYALYGPVLGSQVATLDPTKGFKTLPEGSVLLVVARKLNDAEPAWPMQSKYLAKPGLKS